MDRRDPSAEARLGQGKQLGLVVDVCVAVRREPALDLGEVILLVLVHDDVAAYGEQQPGTADLHRLVDAVTVGEDRGLAALP